MVSASLLRASIVSALVMACTPAQITPPPQPPAPAPAREAYHLELSDGGELSLTATQVPVSRILSDLRARYGIAVELPESRDTVVTDSFVSIPLDSALRRLAPGTHPHIDVLGRDWALRADSGEKVGRRTARDRRLPPKDTVAVFPPDDALPGKARPDTTARAVPLEGAALKSRPDTTPTPATEPKRRAAAVQDTTRHLWLTLTLTRSGELGIEAARLLDGPRVVSPVPEGPYYYVIAVAGRPVAVGTFPDPFEIRAYNPDPRGAHRLAQADTARFVATLPGEGLAGARAEDVDVRVFRLRPGAEPPAVELTRAAELMRVLEPVGRLGAGAPRALLDRVLRPPNQ